MASGNNAQAFCKASSPLDGNFDLVAFGGKVTFQQLPGGSFIIDHQHDGQLAWGAGGQNLFKVHIRGIRAEGNGEGECGFPRPAGLAK